MGTDREGAWRTRSEKKKSKTVFFFFSVFAIMKSISIHTNANTKLVCKAARGRVLVARAAKAERERESCLRKERVEETSRRALLSAGLGFTFLSSARAAYAILPDDDDEELIQRAKAKRASKIKTELATERNFVGITKPTEEEIKTVQLAVAKIVKTGALIEQGDTENAASVIGTSSTPWASNLTSLAKRKSAGAASEPAGMMLSSLQVLQTSLMNSDDKKAKVAYSATASAMEDFIAAVGMKGSIKGL